MLERHYGEYGAARGLYERCLALRPDDGNTHSNLAILLNDRFQEYGAARGHYERAIELDPTNASGDTTTRCSCATA